MGYALRAARNLKDRFGEMRDHLLTDSRFLAWAGAFPPTRIVARKRAAKLFDLCAGFVYSQILYACVTLDLFEILRDRPRQASLLARRFGMPEDAVRRLLAGAVALRLVERRGGDRFGLGPLGAAIVANPGVAAMVRHHDLLYADLADPVSLLRGARGETELAAYWPYANSANPARLSAEAVAPYSRLMSLSQPLVAEEIFDVYPFSRHSCLLDIGGGEGAFLIAVGRRAPSLKLLLFDLPAVAARASENLAKAGFGPRSATFGGDFRTDDLPKGADVATLVRVLLDHDDRTVLKILKAARRALKPGGTLLIAEPMAESPGAELIGDAYFGFYLMAMGGGRPRSSKELGILVEQAGFTGCRFTTGRRVLRTGVMTARC